MRRWRTCRAAIRAPRPSLRPSAPRTPICCSATNCGTAISRSSETRRTALGVLRKIALLYMVILLSAASLNYIPGLTDAEGRAFGIFALDIYDDALHVASGLWAGISALVSSRAARIFLRYFGLLYLTDGLLGLATGSGYLDLGILNHGMVELPLTFKILANLPHIAGGAFAIFASVRYAHEAR